MLNKIRTATPAQLMVAAFLVRLVLVAYSVFHDAHFPVAYTDVDYLVVSDGARHMGEGNSPFDRETYRYTPLLALVFVPNVVLGQWWGKVVLALCDVVAGYFVLRVLSAAGNNNNNAKNNNNEQQSKVLVSVWIWFNPVVVNVSTRGNSDIIIAALTLGSLAAFAQNSFVSAGLFLGFAIHMKIYPIIYAAPFVFCLFDRWWTSSSSASSSSSSSRSGNKRAVAARGESPRSNIATSATSATSSFTSTFLIPIVKAGLATVFGALAPTALCYAAYGQRFLDEAVLYHVGRVDHRHNLSPYFLQMYYGLFELEELGTTQLTSSLLAFVPQMAMLVVVSWILRRNAAHAIALETMLFVAFNKVCTVQYFVWYLPFLPFLFSTGSSDGDDDKKNGSKSSSSSTKSLIFPAVFWVVSLGLWMLHGKLLEFDGRDTFSKLWLCSCLFFVAQVVLAVVMLRVALRSQKRAAGNNAAARVEKRK